MASKNYGSRANLPHSRTDHVPIDTWIEELTIEQIGTILSVFRGKLVPLLQESEANLRGNCGICEPGQEGQSRSLSIDPTHSQRRWYCHGECKQGGRFTELLARELGLPDATKKNFGIIVKKLQAVLEGTLTLEQLEEPKAETPLLSTLHNVPLPEKENETARLIDTVLPDKLTWDTARMPPVVAQRIRRFGEAEVYSEIARMGYLPKDTGGEKVGGSLRGLWVMEYPNEQGQNLCFLGWDHEFPEKDDQYQIEQEVWQQQRERATVMGKPFKTKAPRKPLAFRTVKDFHRSIELWGQHLVANPNPVMKERLAQFGVVLTLSPLDAVQLLAADIPALATCGELSREQALKAARFAQSHDGCGMINLLHDCTAVGESQIRQRIALLAQTAAVHLPMTQTTHQGKLQGKTVVEIISNRDHRELLLDTLIQKRPPWTSLS